MDTPSKDSAHCIMTNRLLAAARGSLRLEDEEREHAGECKICQSVYHIFVCQQTGIPFTDCKKNTAAA